MIECDELGLDEPPARPVDCNFPDIPASSPAVIQYTSGSTGAPRGVLLTHGNIMANAKGIGEACRFEQSDVLVSWLPLYHDMGLFAAVSFTVCWGFETVLGTPMGFLSRPISWLQAIGKNRATISVAPPFAYNLCAQRLSDQSLRGLDLSSWRLALVGAETVGAKTVEGFVTRFRDYGFSPASICPVYGLAEATLAVTTATPGAGAMTDAVSIQQIDGRRVAVPGQVGSSGVCSYVSVGRPLPGHDVTIVDPTTSLPCGDREVGEIVVVGPSLSPRYYGEPENGVRVQLHTGDIGYVADGSLHVIDRLKDLIIVTGQNYAPADLEACVAEIGVLRGERCAAFSIFDNSDDAERVCLAIEVGARFKACLAELRDTVQYEIRRRFGLTIRSLLFVPRGTLKRTTSGKIQRSECRRLFECGTLASVQYPIRFEIPNLPADSVSHLPSRAVHRRALTADH